MTDIFTKAKRRSIMQSVRSHSTSPEIGVRKILSRHGFRYRLNVRKLPGSPDIVFSRLGKVIFVHGCYWHRHRCVRGRSVPSANRKFWEEKFERNVKRDLRVRAELRRDGWRVLVVWECQIKRAPERVEERILDFLQG